MNEVTVPMPTRRTTKAAGDTVEMNISIVQSIKRRKSTGIFTAKDVDRLDVFQFVYLSKVDLPCNLSIAVHSQK